MRRKRSSDGVVECSDPDSADNNNFHSKHRKLKRKNGDRLSEKIAKNCEKSLSSDKTLYCSDFKVKKCKSSHPGSINHEDRVVERNVKSDCSKLKKKVKWGTNLVSFEEKKSPINQSSEDAPSKQKLQVPTSSMLDILAQTNTVVHKPKKASLEHEMIKLKRREKLQPRNMSRKSKTVQMKAERLAKKARKNINVNGTNAPQSITDLNVKKIKLKKKMDAEDLEMQEAKKPRLDSGRKSITPEREIVPGYQWKELTGAQKDKFKNLTRKKKMAKKFAPKINLLNFANYSSLIVDDEERSPLTLSDLQDFLIYTLYNQRTSGSFPTWVTINHIDSLSKVVFVIVDGLSQSDFLGKEDTLPALNSFKYQLDVITPYAYNGDFVKELFQVPLSATQRQKLIKKFGSLENAVMGSDVFASLKNIYPAGIFRQNRGGVPSVKPQEKTESTEEITAKTVVDAPSTEDAFPRTELLLRSWDMIKENVPVPYIAQQIPAKYQGFMPSRDYYEEVSDKSPIWAVDCEMCQTKFGSELTRVSVINENFEVVYESLVKPYNPIINYLTQYSGITRRDLENVRIRLEDVQEDLRQLLPPDVILAGHSVGFDLRALKLFHPYIIDTSACFNLSGVRGRKTKLKTLMAELLSERIQDGGASGHDSIEDAASCLKLLKTKLSRSIEWGNAVLGHKMTEEESVVAQQLLLERDRNKQKPDYAIAANAIIRSGPRLSHFPQHNGQTQPPHLAGKRNWGVPKVPALQNELLRSNKAYNACVHSKSLFSHLISREKKHMLVVGDDKFIKGGFEIAKSKPQFVKKDSRLQFSVQNFQEVLSYGCKNAPSSGVTLLRLSCQTDSMTKSIEEVDGLLQEALAVMNNTTEHVLFTVLLTGKITLDESQANSNHGLFMMKIIKPRYVPLTIEDIS